MFSITEILFVVIFILIGFYYWITNKLLYWKHKKVPYIRPLPLFGNLKDIVLMKLSVAESLQKLYHHKLAENQSFIGINVFHTPALLIREPELIKRILVKDFNKFSNRYSKTDPHTDILGAKVLFFMKNPEWKVMRSKLSPTFTSGKMKQMFSLVNDVGKQMDAYLCELSRNSKNHFACIDVKETCSLYTTDVIASTAYGIQANSLKNPNGEFRKNGKRIFDFTISRALDFTLIFFIPQFVSLFKSQVFTSESTKFLRSTINYVIKEREKSGISRNDLIDILIALKKASAVSKDKNDIQFKGDVIVAQAAAFFAAGFETTSATMAFGLYEISKKPKIQDRLRQEIKDVLVENNGDITYESIQNMEYMNMVIQEVLRLYPPLPFLDRECTLSKDEEGYSLEPFSDYKVPNGMPIYIPIYATQRDPKYFPNPNHFDPERFSQENKDNISSSVYMPFGTGPHNCIGERFALMQMKVGLIYFFKNNCIKPSARSPAEMKLERKALIIQAEGGIYCNIINDPLFK